MDLQIDYLKTFLSLTETKGFTKTGIALNKSQSAVSMQIKRLESEVGEKLFLRIGKSVKLTTVGRLLLKHAFRIVKEHDDAVRALSKPDMEGTIRFGSPEHYTVGILPDLLAKFAAFYPDVVVEMQCKNSDEIKKAVEKSELDIGISSQLNESDQILAHDPLVWIVNDQFSIQDHQRLPIALFDEGCMFRTWALKALGVRNINYRIVYVSQSVSGLIDAVRGGLAVAPIIRSNVPADLKILGLEQGLPVLPVTNIVLHKSHVASEIVECFSEHIISRFSEKSA